jgi:hypothetical protein
MNHIASTVRARQPRGQSCTPINYWKKGPDGISPARKPRLPHPQLENKLQA